MVPDNIKEIFRRAHALKDMPKPKGKKKEWCVRAMNL